MERIYKENSSKSGGVYRITNKTNGKFYIGSTKCFQVRVSQHEKQLLAGKHGNPHLQNAFNLNGTDNFLFEVICIIDGPKQNRLNAEQKLLDLHWDNCVNCYNIDKKSQSKEGSKHSEFTKQKLSNFHKGKLLSKETKQKISKSRSNNPHEKQFKKGQHSPNKGKLWEERYGEVLAKEIKEKSRQSHLKNDYRGLKHSNAKIIENINLSSPTGTIYTKIECLSVFCKEHNLNVSHLHAVIHGKRKTHKNWQLIN